MLIPVGTDAPLYHRPWATGGLIVANVLALVFVGGAEACFGLCSTGGWGDWILQYGDGLHPAQWVTCAFVHFGILHLVGNMIFLWTFGMIVEGKIGWWRFLLLYLGIAVSSHGFEQMLMANYHGLVPGSGGASGVIFGLIGVAVIWAPENEIELLWLFFFGSLARYMNDFSVRVYTFGALYAVLEFFNWWAFGFTVSTPALHLNGALFGTLAGIAVLKLGWVDCENWDLFSVWSNRHLGKSELPERASLYNSAAAAPKAAAKRMQVRRFQLKLLRQHLDAGDHDAAVREYTLLRGCQDDSNITDDDRRRLADALYERHRWEDAIPVLSDLLQNPTAATPLHALRRAALAVKIETRPQLAVRLLEGIDPALLDVSLRKQHALILAKARRMIDDGVLEISS
jgi:membrane associated rhomboid family serine protease